MVQEINQPIESGGGPPQPPNGVSGGTQPLLPERDRRIPQTTGRWRRKPHHLMAMVVVMVIVMVVEEVIDHLPQGENSSDNGDGGGDDSPLPSDHGQPRHRQGQRDRWVYVVQGPPGPPGQPGQDGRDGHDGHAPQLPRGMIKHSRNSSCSIGHYRFRKIPLKT